MASFVFRQRGRECSMDAPHFDALTRRLTIGLSRRRSLVLFGILGLGGLDSSDVAAKNKKKKRCPPCKKRKKGKCKGTLPDGAPCPGGSCQGGRCQQGCLPTDQCCAADDCPLGFLCCDGFCSETLFAAGAACTAGSRCCSNYCQFIHVGENRCAPTCRGGFCELDRDCCRGFPCLPVEAAGLRFCGGCVDVAGAACETDADCCFSDCTQLFGSSTKFCGSLPGGPCDRSANCTSCGSGGDCTEIVDGTPREICQDGICGCPDHYECCAAFECDLNETCVFVREGGAVRGECRPFVP